MENHANDRRYSFDFDTNNHDEELRNDRAAESTPLQDASEHRGDGHSPEDHDPVSPISRISSVKAPATEQVIDSQRSLGSDEKDVAHTTGWLGRVKYSSSVLFIYFLYSAIAITSWTFLCILVHKPIGVPTYFDQTGLYYQSKYEASNRYRKAATFGMAVISAIGIPVTSAVAARAAAVYTQKNSRSKVPRLSLRQMLALADKGWSGFNQAWTCLKPGMSHRVRSPLLLFSFLLVAVAFAISVLQGILVNTTEILVYSVTPTPSNTNVSVSNCSRIRDTAGVGLLSGSSLDLATDSIIPKLIGTQMSDRQPNLWSSSGDFKKLTSPAEYLVNLSDTSNYSTLPLQLFTTSVPVGTDTGVIRNIAMRINSSVSCELVPQEQIPNSCGVGGSFNVNFSNIDKDSDSAPFTKPNSPKYRGRVCSTNNATGSPYKETILRQDFFEEFWLDFEFTQLYETYYGDRHDAAYGELSDDLSTLVEVSNFTQHCSGNTTLAYFEIPNYFNGYQLGNLLDSKTLQSHDHGTDKNQTFYNLDDAEVSESVITEIETATFPGPLIMSLHAIFGNGSFFQTLVSMDDESQNNSSDNMLCQQLRYPFSGLSNYLGLTQRPWYSSSVEYTNWILPEKGCVIAGANSGTGGPSDVLRTFFTWMLNFAHPDRIMSALTLSEYIVHDYMLSLDGPVPIQSCPGQKLSKPQISLPALIAITVLLGIQIIGLGYMAFYSHLRPAWTETLDSFAMMKIGAEIERHRNFSGAETYLAEETRLLDELDGWVGEDHVAPLDLTEEKYKNKKTRRLFLGGSGKVRGWMNENSHIDSAINPRVHGNVMIRPVVPPQAK